MFEWSFMRFSHGIRFLCTVELNLLQNKLGTHLLQTIAEKTESDLIQEMYNSLYLKSMDIFSTIT